MTTKQHLNRAYRGMTCRVCLIRDNSAMAPSVELKGPRDVYELVKEELVRADREIFLAVLISAANTLIGVETVSMGTLTSCVITAREVFKSAILANAASIIVCHNHPSGSLIPSAEDIRITETLARAGELLDIKMLDHLIISYEGYRSIIDP